MKPLRTLFSNKAKKFPLTLMRLFLLFAVVLLVSVAVSEANSPAPSGFSLSDISNKKAVYCNYLFHTQDNIIHQQTLSLAKRFRKGLRGSSQNRITAQVSHYYIAAIPERLYQYSFYVLFLFFHILSSLLNENKIFLRAFLL